MNKSRGLIILLCFVLGLLICHASAMTAVEWKNVTVEPNPFSIYQKTSENQPYLPLIIYNGNDRPIAINIIASKPWIWPDQAGDVTIDPGSSLFIQVWINTHNIKNGIYREKITISDLEKPQNRKMVNVPIIVNDNAQTPGPRILLSPILTTITQELNNVEYYDILKIFNIGQDTAYWQVNYNSSYINFNWGGMNGVLNSGEYFPLHPFIITDSAHGIPKTGRYTGIIKIGSNDPSQPEITYSFILNVVAPIKVKFQGRCLDEEQGSSGEPESNIFIPVKIMKVIEGSRYVKVGQVVNVHSADYSLVDDFGPDANVEVCGSFRNGDIWLGAGWYPDGTPSPKGYYMKWNPWVEAQLKAKIGNGAISTFGYSNLVLKKDGSIITWGRNDYGQCDVPLGKGFKAVAAGFYHSLALKNDGSLVAWGSNDYGQCNVPPGKGFKAVAAAGSWSLALKNDGSLVAWGSNDYGQCNVPPGKGFKAVSGGGCHSLALKNDGSLVAWGSNDYGQCNVPSGKGFKAIATGFDHCIALKSDGSIITWGRNDYGQCNVPPGKGFKAIAAGPYNSLALKNDGSLVAWGSNDYGQCNVPSEKGFKAIATGYDHCISLKSDGSVVAWGGNEFGQCNIPIII